MTEYETQADALRRYSGTFRRDVRDAVAYAIGHERPAVARLPYPVEALADSALCALRALPAEIRRDVLGLTADKPDSVKQPSDARIREVDSFLVEYAKWVAHRSVLSEQEDSGHFPRPGAWADSDDTAVDLLRNAAKLLGARDD